MSLWGEGRVLGTVPYTTRTHSGVTLAAGGGLGCPIRERV